MEFLISLLIFSIDLISLNILLKFARFSRISPFRLKLWSKSRKSVRKKKPHKYFVLERTLTSADSLWGIQSHRLSYIILPFYSTCSQRRQEKTNVDVVSSSYKRFQIDHSSFSSLRVHCHTLPYSFLTNCISIAWSSWICSELTYITNNTLM